MKNKSIKRFLTVALCAVMLTSSLAACGEKEENKEESLEDEKESKESKDEESSEEKEEASEQENSAESGVEESKTGEDAQKEEDHKEETKKEEQESSSTMSKTDQARLMNEYAGMLTSISMNGCLPEDLNSYNDDFEYYYNLLNQYESINYDTGEILTCNHYAIADIDSDGVEELLVYIDSDKACMADMCTLIYQYDLKNNNFYRESTTFLDADFYDNGYLVDFHSHNQTYGDMWPYTLEKYNPATDSYEYVADAYSWNKEYNTQDYSGETFPDQVDVDGDGVVYIVNDSNGTTYYDEADFLAFEKVFTSANKIDISKQNLIYDVYSVYTNDFIRQSLEDGRKSQSGKIVFDLAYLYMDLEQYNKYLTTYEYDGETYTYFDQELALRTELEPFFIDQSLPSEEEENWEETTFIDRKGDVAVSLYQLDGGGVSLKEKVEGLYLFGIQPGMTLEEARKVLDTYHARESWESYYNEELGVTYYYYMIGSNAWFHSISIGVDNEGIVVNVSTYQGCSYAG